MASTYLSRTISSAGSGTTFTISCWFKRSQVSTDQYLFSSRDTGVSGSSVDQIFISNTDSLIIEGYNGSAYTYRKVLNRKFRDTSAWYHLVIAFDTSNSTADDRIKIYINGVRETSFSTSTNPSSSFNTYWLDTTDPFVVGSDVRSLGSTCFNGLISHLHFSDGYALAPTVFGSTDATTGEWKINTSPSFTLGTNGFTILKDGNTITDQSSNSNNFTLGGGTLTKTEDNPSNVFATFNPLAKLYNGTYTFTNGNTTCEVNVRRGTHSTLGASSGKFYWETKLISNNNTNNNATGISAKHSTAGNDGTGEAAEEYVYKSDGQKTSNNTSSSYGNSYTNGDIIGVAMDLDNNKLYFSKNGTWQNSGVPTSGSTGTGAISITAPASTTDNFYVANAGNENDTAKWSANFGNGYFGTTAVSSAGTNASGNGIFEYDVPTGYTALSTKGLNL
jgi:hypothetical protein